MNRFILYFAVVIIVFNFNYTFSQSIIINELYNSGGNDEWIELLVLDDNLDLRGWSLRDFSSTGVAQLPLVFSNSTTWNNLKKGTLIVIGRPENTFVEDLDPSDFSMTVKTSNSLFFSGNPFLFAGSSEAIQIRNASQVHVHGVSWGSGNAASIPQPKVHFTTASTSNTSIFFNEDDLIKINSAANWTMNGIPSRGAGNTANNIAWINSLRARAEGSGTVSLIPLIATGDSLINLRFNYKRDPQYQINTLKIIVPNGFTWSQSTSSINTTNFTSTITVTGDTISFANVVFNNDSVLIFIDGIRTPIFTGSYKFSFQSGINNTLGEVSPLPILTVYGSPIPIAEAKVNNSNGVALRLGELVTVRGIVTVAGEFGSPSYIQDNSGGMSVYGPSFSNSVQVGDEVLVSGRITQFSGLNQIEFPELHSILSTGNVVEPLLTTPSQLSGDGVNGVEIYEGNLVRLNAVLVTELNGSPVTNWAYKNYRLTGAHPGDTVDVRIDNDTQIIGMVAPAGKFDIIGVLSQYKTTAPFIGGYQLMPRFPSDIISVGPIIEKFPEEVALTPNSISLEWSTISPGNSRIRYGKTTNYELGVVSPDNVLRTEHYVTVSGLETATIYNLQAFSVSNSDTSFSSNIVSSTTSDFPTTGVINVYFNKDVNTTVSSGVNATGNVDFKSKIIQKIHSSRYSIDVALYSLSGTVGAEIASALVIAKNRGVKVRVIGEYDTRTTAPWTTIQNNGIPYINDRFGSNDGAGLHHNKFFVFDYKGGSPDSIWIVTGSWNPTDPGTNDDRQNIVEIQDVALAGAFTLEFEEMWGGNTDTPNAVHSRFGSRKLNNTPHNFMVGGKHVQLYFSPSDRTTSFIGRTIGKAAKSLNAAVMTFTRKELADSVIALKNRSGKTRVILSNNTDSGSQFSFMQANGVDIRLKGFTTGLLHHKYAVVDAEPFGLTPYVISGSHNWSSSAENSNDENTLIIQDAQTANFYLQEFAARYYEAGGTDSIFITSVEDVFDFIPSEFSLSQNFPNPFNPVTTIRFALPSNMKPSLAAGKRETSNVKLIVYDMLGREVTTLVNEEKSPGTYEVKWDAVGVSSGIYFYRLTSGSFIETKKMILLR